MRRTGVETAAVEIGQAPALATWKHYASVESVPTLAIDEADFPQGFEGIAECREVAAQVAAGGIANTQTLDEVGIVQAPLMEVLQCLTVARKLGLIESYRLLQEFGLGD